MAKVKSLSLIDLIKQEKTKFGLFQEAIFKTDIKDIASKENSNFWFEFLNKFNSPRLIAKISTTILDKLKTHINLNHNKEITNDLIYALKAETLLIKGQNILKNIKANPEPINALNNAQIAVANIEKSYFVYQSIFNINKKLVYKQTLDAQIKQTHKTLNDTIASIANVQEQFNLYELALGKRKANFKEGQDDYLVDLFIKLGAYGVKLPSLEVKLAAMKYNEEAYNIVCKHNIDKNSAPVLFKILKNMKELAKEFGDNGKAKLILNQIEYIESDLMLQEEGKNNNENNRIYIPILEQGSSTETILNIKMQIQHAVLDEVQAASAIGKWIKKIAIMNYGVLGYLDEDYLARELGALNSEENIKIARKLCFEAINIGIMNSENYNPLCAAIFAKEYPDLIKEILKDNPEYFVDGAILRVSLLDADTHSKRLTGKVLNENDSGYNRYFEKEMEEIIVERTKDTILLPIKEIITKKEWSPFVEQELTYRLSDECISQTVGNNLPQIPDMFNIVRILALREITQELEASGSMIFAPVQLFTRLYPELVKRVQENHADFVDNETVTKCIKREFERQETEAAEELLRKEKVLAEEQQKKELEEQQKKEAEEEEANALKDPVLIIKEGDEDLQIIGEAEASE